MPKHDEATGKGRIRLSTTETAMGPRLFVWDMDGNNLGIMTWAKVFNWRVLSA